MNKIENTSQSIGLLEKALQICEKYSVLQILKALAVLLTVSAVLFIVFNPSRIFELYDDYKERQHDEAMKQRTLYAPQIQTALDQLRINTKADRVLFLEYHNGTVSTGGLPFKYASAAFESLSDDIYPVAPQYADVNLTLLPFASYIHKHSYHCGNIDQLKDIDKSLMYRMMSNNVEHLAITEVRGVKEPLGILVLTYTHPIEHSCDEIRAQMDRTAIDIAVKLELKKK